jgi:hypothetical protein
MTQVIRLAIARSEDVQRADTFAVRPALQGLYDEMSQATLQFMTASEIDDLQAMLTTPDWVFVDESGRRYHWPQMRKDAIHPLIVPRPDSITQTIGKLSLEGGVVTALINRTTVRSIADEAGRPAGGGACAVAALTTFRDRWIRVGGEWKLQSRQQIGKAIEALVGR